MLDGVVDCSRCSNAGARLAYAAHSEPPAGTSQPKNEPFVVPVYALIAAPAIGLTVGALAGLYPATKAARLSPTEALRTA